MHIAPRHVEEDDVERLLDVKQVAERLGIAERTVVAMTADGRFLPPSLYLGRFARWRVADFNEWVEQAARQSKGRKR